MSLNIDKTREFIKINRSQGIFNRRKNKLPLISLINKKNFKLTSKKRGKLLNKPVYSGFNKNTLSSIPRDVEIILLNKNKEEIFNKSQNILNNIETNTNNFNDKKSYQTMNDNTHITSFVSKTLTDKKINPSITNESLNKINSKINQGQKVLDNIKKTKDYWKLYKNNDKKKKTIPNDKSHLSINLYKSQFYPGPSDYSGDKSFDALNQQNKFRYKSLFKSQSYHSIKTNKEYLPGPGSYIQLKNFNNNNKHLSINLGTKEQRFKNLFSSASLSPWFYSSSNKDNQKINQSYNNLGLLNKGDLYDFKRYIIKEEADDKGKIHNFYIEDNSSINKSESPIRKSNIKNKMKFKKKENRSINDYKLDKMLQKYIIVRNAEKEYEVPGPGQYNIYVGFDKISKDKAIEKLQIPHKKENLIPEEVLKNYSQNKNKNPTFMVYNGGNENNKNKENFGNNNCKSCEDISYKAENKNNNSGTLPFISKQKRIKYQDVILSKHNPGPCYYFNDEPY